MTEELKQKILDIVELAYKQVYEDGKKQGNTDGFNEGYAKGYDDGERKASKDAENKYDDLKAEYDAKLKTCAENLAAEKQASFDEGYKQGCSDTLKNIDIKPSVEPEVEEEPTDVSMEIDLENSAVKAFMADVDYTGYAKSDAVSKVNNYVIGNVVEGGIGEPQSWTERPTPLILGKDGDIVRLSANGTTREYSGGSTIYNLIPQTNYDCEIIHNGNVVGKGTISTKGNVRMIAFETESCIYNSRDLGGYKCKGGRVAYGKIIRSSFLQNTLTKDSENARILREDLGVNLEIGLGRTPIKGCGWETVQYSINSYAPLLTTPKDTKNVINAIANNLDKGCTLIHCLAGADRTGTISAIILGLLGVSESDIIKEWELTSFCSWCNFKRISDEAKNKANGEFPNGELRTFLRKVMSYTGDTLADKFEWWLTKKVGVTASTISKLRTSLIVKTEDEIDVAPLNVIASESDFATIAKNVFETKEVNDNELNAVSVW